MAYQVAAVAEADCIGCTACAQACPTGAIVGATKQLHTILADLCTACGACLPVCPVPCIAWQPWPEATHPLQGPNSHHGEAAAAAHAKRLAAPATRGVLAIAAVADATALVLPPSLHAKAEQARQKSLEKYKKMGPLQRPRALPRG